MAKKGYTGSHDLVYVTCFPPSLQACSVTEVVVKDTVSEAKVSP